MRLTWLKEGMEEMMMTNVEECEEWAKKGVIVRCVQGGSMRISVKLSWNCRKFSEYNYWQKIWEACRHSWHWFILFWESQTIAPRHMFLNHMKFWERCPIVGTMWTYVLCLEMDNLFNIAPKRAQRENILKMLLPNPELRWKIAYLF